MMTEEELREIERFAEEACADGNVRSYEHLTRLIAEVRELQAEVKYLKYENCGCLF